METSQRGSQGGGLKKGPWTAAEDAILMDYVKKHGEGNWNSVQKHSGLMRCGKSCRLRWANHLRPNLKKGSFTPDEERIIIDLHAKLGNKWARMASQLPGRTDNEIKNFWNTRLKRRQRAGLPIYPQEFPEESLSSPFRIHQQHLHRQKHHNSSSSSSPFSCRKTSYNNNPSISLLDPIINFASPLDPLQNHFSSFYSSNPTFQFKPFPDHRTPNNINNNNSISLALPLSQYARPSPPAAHIPSFGQKFASPAIPTPPPLPPSLSYNPTTDFENNISFTSLIMGGHVEPVDNFPDSKTELPSIQMPPPGPAGGGGGVGGEATTKNSDINNNDIVTETALGNWNSGLLDALLMESQNLSRKDKSDDDKGKRVMDENEEEYMEVTKRVKLSSENCAAGENQYCDDFSSSQSSIGVKPSDHQEAIEEMNSMGDDLLSLLDGFPSSTPLPEWYQKTNMSDGNSSGDAGGDGVGGGGLEVDQQETSTAAATAENNQGVEWGFGSSYWNNMPGIC